MTEKLIDKQLGDMDELLQFLSDNGFEIDRKDLSNHNISLREVFEQYKKNTIPDVTVGQTVWVVTKGYRGKYEIKKCCVYKKQIKTKYVFSVKYKNYYHATFVKNSIGRVVFFSKDAAVESLSGKEYELEE